MGLIERINRKNQNIGLYGEASAEDWLPSDIPAENLAVFGGSAGQRNRVTVHAIARCLGLAGIIVLHNNDGLEAGLRQMQQHYPWLFMKRRDLKACFVNSGNLVYEPLYGMEPERVVEAVYPELSHESPSYLHQHLCAEALRQYLGILQYTGRTIHLDHLLDLCGMELDELEQTELAKLPPKVAEDMLAVLMQENVARQVRADLNHFAGLLEGRIYSRSLPPTSVSLTEAVGSRAMLSVKLSTSHPAILHYLAAELGCLLERGACFLLVVDSVPVGGSALEDILQNPSGNMATIVAGSSGAQLCGQQESGLYGRASKIILFQAPNAQIAQQYSGLIGTYLRRFASISDSESRGAFELFAGHGSARSISEQDYARIRPEELAALGEGAVLIDQRAGIVEKVNRFCG